MPIHHPQHRIRKVNPDYIDSIMSVIAVLSPLTVVPQIFQIYQTKDAAGVSLVTWIFSIATSLIWLAYGFHHRDKPVIYNSFMGSLFCTIVAFGVLLYR